MKLLVLGIFGLMMNSAFAYTYNCKAEDETSTMVIKDVPQGKQVTIPLGHGEEVVLVGKQSGYEQVNNRTEKYIYSLTDENQNPAEMTMLFRSFGGRFGNFPVEKLAFNYNTTFTYLGVKTLYACYTNYQN